MLQKQLTSISPIRLNAKVTAGPSSVAEGNKPATRLQEISLYYVEVAQVLTPFILLLPAWRKKAISNLSQITAAENCYLTCSSPHVPLPPHNPLLRLSQPSPQELTGTSGDEEAKILQIFLLRNKGKTCI